MDTKKTVAVIGASADRSKYGNKSVRAHVAQGWDVYPINPAGGEIEGLQAYRSITEVPVNLKRVSMYVPPEIGITLLDSIAAASPEEFFLNPGSERDDLIAAAKALGLDPIVACSIVDIGELPASYA